MFLCVAIFSAVPVSGALAGQTPRTGETTPVARPVSPTGPFAKWLETGGLKKIEDRIGNVAEPIWQPSVFGTPTNPCGLVQSCTPGVGGPKPPKPQPPPSPCGATMSCSPGVGSIGGVLDKEELDSLRTYLRNRGLHIASDPAKPVK